ncbi:MAG: hypothetical protein PHD61_09580 [Bacteroidales bacterium]|nr:hypothetical protein [Lentimicrobiaceae bacterium]MDD5695536.1 hypothetical protein [Bacteroidales bacterium]
MANQVTYILIDWEEGKCAAKQEYFSDEDWIKIQNKQKEMYDSAVEKLYQEKINDYEQQRQKSTGPARLLKDEYNLYDNLFNSEPPVEQSPVNPFAPIWLNLKDSRRIRFAYDSLIHGKIGYPMYCEFSEMDKNLKEHPELLFFIKAEGLYKYYQYLNERVSMSYKSSGLSNAQQVLILYYLGEEKIFDIKKINRYRKGQAKLICGLINRDYSNTYEHIRNLFDTKTSTYQDYFTKDNLHAILQYFENAKLQVIIDKINAELDKFG